MSLRLTTRERLLARGWCTGPEDACPAPGSVWLDLMASCPACGRRVKVTTRGRFANHKPSHGERRKRVLVQRPARRLAAIATWINEYLPELVARVVPVRVNTDKPIGRGRRLRRQGKGRRGNRLIVTRKRAGAVLLDHNAAETYRTNSEVEEWLAKYLESRKRR